MDLGPPGSLIDAMPALAAAAVTAASGQHHASVGSTITQLLDSAGTFFSQLASLNWFSLLVGLALYALYLWLRSRALFNALCAAMKSFNP